MIINRNVVLTMSAILTSAFVTACSESANQSAGINNSGSDIEIQSIDNTGPTLKLSSEALEVAAGSTFTLDVELDAFPVTEGGGVNIGYSSEVLQVKDVSINSETWGFVNQQGAIDNSAGTVSNILVSSYQDLAGKAVMATITFEAVAAGNSDITLSESTINPFASTGVAINPLFVSSRVTVR